MISNLTTIKDVTPGNLLVWIGEVEFLVFTILLRCRFINFLNFSENWIHEWMLFFLTEEWKSEFIRKHVGRKSRTSWSTSRCESKRDNHPIFSELFSRREHYFLGCEIPKIRKFFFLRFFGLFHGIFFKIIFSSCITSIFSNKF